MLASKDVHVFMERGDLQELVEAITAGRERTYTNKQYIDTDGKQVNAIRFGDNYRLFYYNKKLAFVLTIDPIINTNIYYCVKYQNIH